MDSLQPTSLLNYEPDVLNIIRKYYNLENGRINQSIDILDSWVKKQKHFKNKDFDREYLERTLITCKGSVEKAKIQLEKICTFRTLLPDYFVYENIADVAGPMRECMALVPIPKMTKDYRRICICQLKKNAFTPTNYRRFFQINILTAEYLKRHDYVNGFIIIVDFSRIDLTHLMSNINLIEFHRFLKIAMEGFGARIVAVHLISSSKIIETFVKMVKPILIEKLRQRIHIHSTIKSLANELGAEYLPKEYEGNQYTMEELEYTWYECMTSEDHERYLKKMQTYCTDELLRDPKDKEQYMELTGSFRTLTVD